MYKIKYNENVIATQQFRKYAVIAGTLNEQINSAAAFNFTLPPDHYAADALDGRNGLIKLYDDDKVVFIGDIVNRSRNFARETTFEFQDAIGWLNDVVTVKPHFSGAVSGYWTYIINAYNAQASEWRQINVGNVTVQGTVNVNYESEFPTTFELVSSLINLRGGYVKVRYDGEAIFLDYLADASATSDQTILFGQNLLDLEDFISEEELYSRVYPRGNDGLDISAVNGGVPYLVNGITQASCGDVGIVVDFDTDSASDLKTKGQAFANNTPFATRTLTLTAFDLSSINKHYSEIVLGANVPVISPPHGINTTLMVNSKTTDIVSRQRSTFTLGLTSRSISGIVAGGISSMQGGAPTVVHGVANIKFGTTTTATDFIIPNLEYVQAVFIVQCFDTANVRIVQMSDSNATPQQTVVSGGVQVTATVTPVGATGIRQTAWMAIGR